MLTMNKIIILSILVLGIFIISGCSKKVIDCGTDTACFSKNFKTCTPAKIFQGTTEIIGGTSKSCNILFQSTDDPKYTGGKRLTMQCTVQNTDTFKDEEMNAYFAFEKGAKCNGDLYDFYSKLGKT